MAARKWTSEQREKQAVLIRSWKPWNQSTGAKTPEGKKISSKNAFNYSLRELLREVARQNRALINYINGRSPAPNWDRTKIDGLLDNLEETLHARNCKRTSVTNEECIENKKLNAQSIDKYAHSITDYQITETTF